MSLLARGTAGLLLLLSLSAHATEMKPMECPPGLTRTVPKTSKNPNEYLTFSSKMLEALNGAAAKGFAVKPQWIKYFLTKDHYVADKDPFICVNYGGSPIAVWDMWEPHNAGNFAYFFYYIEEGSADVYAFDSTSGDVELVAQSSPRLGESQMAAFERLAESEGWPHAARDLVQFSKPASAEDPAVAAAKLQAEKAAADKLALTQYQQDLKSGLLPVKNFSDANMKWPTKLGTSIIISPPFDGDDALYRFSAIVEKRQGNVYVVSIGQIHYGFLVLEKDAVIQKGFAFRSGGPATFIGRFVGTESFNTVSGTERNAPVFKVLYAGEMDPRGGF